MPESSDSDPSFVWGVATSSFQIEGATSEDGRGESIWDRFCSVPGNIVDGSSGAVACDHYHRWPEDLDLLEQLGVNAYRFSVSWPRIIPAGRGTVEPRGLDFYERLVDGLLERGIAPYATLYHWDLPQALDDAGGWRNRDIVGAFSEYAQAVSERLGDRVASWATLNEPWCSAFLGHDTGEHAPGRHNRKEALQVAHHLLLAHGAAIPVMRSNAPGSRHGLVLNLNPAYPASDSASDLAAARRFDGYFNRWFLDAVLNGCYPEDAWEGYGGDAPMVRGDDMAVISAPLDFLGVNYYSRTVVEHADGPWPAVRDVSTSGEVTDMGWEVYPQGLGELLLRLKRDYPIPDLYVTENGAAYPDRTVGGRIDDDERIGYLRGHIAAVQSAAEQGAPVRGYFAWSLLDNFEWAFGYTKRFGLVHVDFDTQARTPKKSARWYAQAIAAGGIPSVLD